MEVVINISPHSMQRLIRGDRGVPRTICNIGLGVLVASESGFQVHWRVAEVSENAVQVA